MPFGHSLTREVSFKVGPVILDVLVKHYFDRLKRDVAGSDSPLKQDDILYDEAFTIVKSFLNASTFHTIEELQAFSNTRTPSPPWTHVVRTVVPMSCCDEAATYLIKALGGEDVARKLVGGVKWWQVRGVNGVDAQWITAKKDWKEAKRRHKREQNMKDLPSPPPTEHVKGKPEGVYEKDMDAMRCILYLHGGGYYFGSVDQERYSIQRFARKINGRVFAINYRLAPQYPFPCALQDAIAAYIYLIRPPPESAHTPVDPGHIIISGDSAGGGLSLALLQVIRDSGLPAPAGGVLISPWCDLTHSFPSVHVNTSSDVIPDSGLSFHKPSLLWPPPSEEVSNRVHASLRFRIRQAFRSEEPQQFTQTSTYVEQPTNGSNVPDHLATPIISEPPANLEKVMVQTAAGEVIEVNQQLHFYTRNSLLGHPLVSPAMSYLGGLPPLLIIAGDKEVLRDEIIYTAHKAAYPEKHPISNETRELYPSLNGIEDRCKPTPVHLQVYDESPHILPVLFSFTNPAKFCFRGIASFCKFATEMKQQPPIPRKTSNASSPKSPSRQQSLFGFRPSPSRRGTISTPQVTGPAPDITPPKSPNAEQKVDSAEGRPSLRRTMSLGLARAGTMMRKNSSLSPSASSYNFAGGKEPSGEQPESKTSDPTSPGSPSVSSSDVGGPRFGTSVPETPEERTAGEPSVYQDIKDRNSWECRMIRERVSTSGVIRPLQPEHELDALKLPCEHIGVFSELTMRRYLKERTLFDKKFAHTSKSIEKHRRRNLERAKEETIRRMSILRQTLLRGGSGKPTPDKELPAKHGVTESPGWGWAWALDEKEDPPPSSIVSRRDTEEARKLAEVADQAILGEDQTFSANNLWGVVINFLTVTPGKEQHHHHHGHHKTDVDSSDATTKTEEGAKVKRHHSRLSRLWHGHPSPQGATE
ncbi:hypothetical protein M413DRAFT_177504 [Hebeloma cylindrosporum]|uniref:Alpha/beta hydrolase fold-3 domain-containing protein n=1 Tax=Hebeloma cylindrosporum TaxID=76867 RepID=A0A0C2YGX8_HEBCY|nr:hypothetical protein M413DRAFT_177504 [Hebeloma cylindrosporum h7]